MINTPLNPYRQNVEIVKGYFKKVPVLILAILKFIGTMLSITVAIVLSGYSMMFIQSISSELSETGLSDLNSLVQSSPYTMIYTLIPTAIVGVLVTVGYMILFIKSRSKAPGSSPRGGATILFVLALIEMIYSFIAAAVILIIFIVSSVAAGVGASLNRENNSFSGNVNPNTIIAIVGFTLAFMLFMMLFYSVNKMRYFKSIKNSCSSTNLYTGGAGAYGVANIIWVVLSFLSIGVIALLIPFASWASNSLDISLDFAYSDMLYESALLIVIFLISVIVISIVYQIIEAAVAIGYKNYINKIKYNYKPAEVPEAPYQPQTQPQPAVPAYPQPQQFANNTQNTSSDYSAPTYCPSCGTPIDPNSDYCSNCGNKIK